MGDSLHRRSNKDIPIRIEGVTRFIKNVTKITTCCDVIKMILKKMNIGKENLPYYTIFESANGVDRPLAGKTCILKTMRSWGSDTSYKFIMRKSAPAVTYVTHLSNASRQKLSQWSKSSSPSSSGESVENDKEGNVRALKETVKKQRRKHLKDKYRISDRELSRQLFADDTSDSDSMDEFMSRIDSEKMTEFWDFCTAVTESEIKRLENRGILRPLIGQNSVTSGTHLDSSSDVKFAKRKQLKKCESVSNLQTSDGKHELLQKYFSEISPYETPKIAKMKKTKRRTNQDSSKNGNVNNGTMSGNIIGPSYSKGSAFYWSVHAESDTDSTDLDSSLERAFVAECDISSSSHDSGIKLKSYDVISDDLKIGCYDNIQKLVDYSLSDDEDSDSFKKSRDFDIRDFWSSGEVYNEDDAMDSFMNSKLRDDFSDEGLSSMGSDVEKETFV